MKYLMILSFISLVSIGKGQVKMPPHGGMAYPDPMQPIVKDTANPTFSKIAAQSEYSWQAYQMDKYNDRLYFSGRNKGGENYSMILPTTDSTPDFRTVVFLMQQNMELSQRADRLETKLDSLTREFGMRHQIDLFNVKMSNVIDSLLQNRIDSLERRPVIYIDNLQKELWVKCPDGSCDIFIRKL